MRHIGKAFSFVALLVAALSCLRLSASCEDLETVKLKDRATQFFRAVQLNQLDKAVQYVIEKGRSNFKSQGGKKIVGFEITKITMENSGQSAIVEASYKVLVQTIIRQVEIPNLTRWKLASGEWFLDPDDPPPQLGDKFQEYYYQKLPEKGKTSAGAVAASKIHFERNVIEIGLVERGKIVNLRFPFTNESSQEIKIEELYLRAPFLKDTTTKRVFKPGEKGEVSVDLDTSMLLRRFEHAFFVAFLPIKVMIPLTIKGQVSVKTKS